MGLLGLVLTGFSVYLGVASDSKVTKPNEGDIQVLIEKSKRANTTESKIDFLLEAETKQLEWSAEQPKSTFRLTRLLNLRNLFIVLPILIILGCVFYLLGWCYPRTVFLWGDFEAHYNDLISKKKAIWSLVILSLVFGIIGNLFVYGLSSYVRIG